MAIISPGGGSGSSAALASGKVSLTTGNLTRVANTFADATGLTVTLTTGAHRCLVTFSATVACSATGGPNGFDIAVDGTRVGGTLGLVDWNPTTSNFDFPLSISFVTDALTAASHTIKLQFKGDNTNTLTIFATTTTPAVFSVVELNA